MMPTSKEQQKQDRAVEDSFPRTARPPKADKRDRDATPTGTPTDERHATETAYQSEREERPQEKPQDR
jgi:hypothetical protein